MRRKKRMTWKWCGAPDKGSLTAWPLSCPARPACSARATPQAVLFACGQNSVRFADGREHAAA